MASSKPIILIVDDSEINRAILAEMLGNEYDIIEAEDGSQAIAILQKYSVQLSVVLLDIVMPVMDGYEVLTVMNENRWIDEVPVIMISAENSSSHIERAYELGVTDFIGRPYDAAVVRRRVINTILLKTKQRNLERLVADQIYEKEKNNKLMIHILSHIVEFRNGESGLHVLHVQTFTEMLLRRLIKMTDKYNIDSSDISLISNASALHDIGKIAIPDEILNKPGRLTDEEFAIMKTHSMAGASMLENLPLDGGDPLVKKAYEICRWHHERYDGRGYPDGLKGDEIPISAQIVSLADVYDALTSERVYKKAFTHETALKMILGGECGTFNPMILECLESIADDIKNEFCQEYPTSDSEKEFKSIADEAIRHDELSATERTLHLLEYERVKNNFYSSISQNILFEYTKNSQMLIFCPYGADKLGIKEVIFNPLEDPCVKTLVEESDLKGFTDALRTTTAEEPVLQYDCMVNYRGVRKHTRAICRTIRSHDDPSEYTGFIGKFIHIDDENTYERPDEKIPDHDTLTGLLTYDYTKKFMQKMINDKPNSQFVMAVTDIDGFRAVNEKYGEAFGDNLLVHFAEKLRRTVRNCDIVSRVGGDEFVIFIECDDDAENDIKSIFSRLHDKNELYPISFSMGAAKADMIGVDCATLFGKASRALYTAKKGGKQQLKFYDDTMSNMLSAISKINKVGRR